MQPRLGQGAFRIAVISVCRARTVSGERSLPALAAAHVRPCADGGSGWGGADVATATHFADTLRSTQDAVQIDTVLRRPPPARVGTQPVTQGIVQPRLPPTARCPERTQHVRIQADVHVLLGVRGTRSPVLLEAIRPWLQERPRRSARGLACAA